MLVRKYPETGVEGIDIFQHHKSGKKQTIKIEHLGERKGTKE